MKKIILISACALLLAVSCDNKADDSIPVVSGLDKISAEAQPETQIDALPLTKSELSASYNQDRLGANLLPLLKDNAEGTSFVYSPLGIQYILAMAANSVCPEKQTDFISECFGAEANLATINSACNKLISNFPAIDLQAKLSVANMALGHSELTFPDVDEELYANIFFAPFCLCDFTGNAEKCRNQINTWAKEHTGGLIDSIYKVESMEAGLMFLNALYFSSNWNTDLGVCGKKPFQGSKVSRNIDMITGTFITRYSEDDNFRIADIPMGATGKFRMALMLPADNSANYDAETIENSWNSFKLADQSVPVSLTMPKFQISGNLNLHDYLADLGVVRTESSCVKVIDTHNTGSYIEILSLDQNVSIDVNENGIAFAATSDSHFGQPISTGDGEEIIPINFTANHPFYFFIYEETSGLRLLSGYFAGE